MIAAVMPSYTRLDIAFERGEGAYLFAEDGTRYLDFASGIAVTALGHGHPRLLEALTTQAAKLWHCSNLFRIPGQDRLAECLVANSFADSVFFCNSGAEAVEAGLKIARKFHDHNGRPERYRVIAFERSFHGRTLATVAAGANELHKQGFDPMVEGFDHVAYNNLSEVRGAITAETAAILVEPVQGEGGIHLAAPEFLRGLRETCDDFGLLLIFDEVQSGMGRTGKLFAHQSVGVTPDVMAVAKGLGGGFPVGACLATEAAASAITAGSHGSTFGGNPLAMAVSNAVLAVILAPGFLDGVAKTGEPLIQGLAALAKRHPKAIKGVRGIGLMIGLECVAPNTAVGDRLRQNGLLTVLAADNVVRLLPPLIIGEEHVAEALDIVERSAAEVAS